MKKTERLDAYNILYQLIYHKTPLLALFQTNIDASPLTKEICFGVARHYLKLQVFADYLLTKRPKDEGVWLCILIGLYQLHFLRIPDYAVVKETVELLEKLKKSWAKGLVNAVLRRFCREKEAIIAEVSKNQAFMYDHPKWFIKKIKQDWPNAWEKILLANNCHPPMTLRVNRLKTNTEVYLEKLKNLDLNASLHENAPDAIILENPINVHELPGFSNGEISVQDAAAQIAASLLDLKPGLRVLDACAAPGGKTCHILETEPNLAACVALDIEANRLARVKENLTRLNLTASLVAGDGVEPNAWWDQILFDRILLDAPCSATGVIRRHPDIKLLRTQAEIDEICKIQQKLLTALWPLLAPGGILVYATCSIMHQENEDQIANFIKQTPDCTYKKIEANFGIASPHGRQILPGDANMDGFFYSTLYKSTA